MPISNINVMQQTDYTELAIVDYYIRAVIKDIADASGIDAKIFRFEDFVGLKESGEELSITVKTEYNALETNLNLKCNDINPQFNIYLRLKQKGNSMGSLSHYVDLLLHNLINNNNSNQEVTIDFVDPQGFKNDYQVSSFLCHNQLVFRDEEFRTINDCNYFTASLGIQFNLSVTRIKRNI
jgi:hypothetical protein